MDNQEKLDDRGMNSGFLRKIENYWYHYKWHTIIGGIILIFIIICIAQCAGRVPPDAYILYAGPKTLTADQLNDMDDACKRLLDEDLNGDDKVQVDFVQYTMLTANSAGEALDNGMMVDGAFQATVLKQLDMEITAGDCVLYFVDPGVFDMYMESSVFMPIKDALGYEPPESVMNDGFSIKLSELDAYKWYNGLGDLPSNTLIAIKNKAIVISRQSEEEREKNYKDNMTFLKKMIDYKMPAE